MNYPYLSLLIEAIMQKNQLKGLQPSFIEQETVKYLNKNGHITKQLLETYNNQKPLDKHKAFKETVKRVREQLGVVYGSFLTQKHTKKERLLKECNTPKECLTLLHLHKSTREREPFYKEIYLQIFNWYTPKHIADIACGFNPLAYAYIPNAPQYTACDLNEKDMNFLQTFFDTFKIKGKAFATDVTTLDLLNNTKEADLILLFKALDSFETLKKNISEDLLKQLSSKHIVVSFPTRSLVSKKEFKQEKRNWFFRFLDEQNWAHETFEVENELFICITKP